MIIFPLDLKVTIIGLKKYKFIFNISLDLIALLDLVIVKKTNILTWFFTVIVKFKRFLQFIGL